MPKKIFLFCWILVFPTPSSAQQGDEPLRIVPLSEEELKQYPIYPIESEEERKPAQEAEQVSVREVEQATIYFPTVEKEEGLLRLDFGWLRLGAEFEGEFAAIQGDEFFPFQNTVYGINHVDRHEDRFGVNKLALISQLSFKNKLYFYSELEAFVNRNEIEDTFFREAHVTFFPMPWLFVKAGLDDRFISPEFTAENDATGDDKRLTEVLPINGTAFWKDEDVGLTIGANHFIGENTTFYWRGSFTNGLNLRFDELTRNQIYPILHDDRDISTIQIELNDTKEAGTGIGIRHLFRDDIRFNLFGFYIGGHLRESDRDFLQEVIPAYSNTSKAHSVAGLNFSFHFPYIDFFSQYIHARNGAILRNGFYLEPSIYLATEKRDFLNGVRLLYRINDLDVELKRFPLAVSTSPFLWDRWTHSFGLNIQLHPYVLLRNELHWNRENTEGDPKEVYNNEFLSQVEVKF